MCTVLQEQKAYLSGSQPKPTSEETSICWRSANDFPSALSKDELYGTSKMAESQTGPLQMLRQKACS